MTAIAPKKPNSKSLDISKELPCDRKLVSKSLFGCHRIQMQIFYISRFTASQCKQSREKYSHSDFVEMKNMSSSMCGRKKMENVKFQSQIQLKILVRIQLMKRKMTLRTYRSESQIDYERIL